MNTNSEIAEYVGEMSLSLSAMARENGLGSLAFLLEMAALEARKLAEGASEKSPAAA